MSCQSGEGVGTTEEHELRCRQERRACVSRTDAELSRHFYRAVPPLTLSCSEGTGAARVAWKIPLSTPPRPQPTCALATSSCRTRQTCRSVGGTAAGGLRRQQGKRCGQASALSRCALGRTPLKETHGQGYRCRCGAGNRIREGGRQRRTGSERDAPSSNAFGSDSGIESSTALHSLRASPCQRQGQSAHR